MRLGALLDTPELGLTLLFGPDAREREFERVFTSTLSDPTRYLTGGELVLCGMRWLPAPADADAFVATLVQAGVVALGAGTAEAPGPVPDYMIESCRGAGLPLFEVPVSVSFATVSERVILGLAAERAGPGGLAGHRRLLAAVTAGGGLPALVEAGAAELGADCWVLSATGRVIAGTSDDPAGLDAAKRAQFARRYLMGERLPRVADGFTLLASANKAGHRMASWFVVVAGDHARWEPAQREVAAEFAALAGLERSRLDDAKRIENRLAEPLLRKVLSEGATQPELTSRLAAAGFSGGEQVLVLSAGVQGGGPGLAPVILDEVLAPFDGPALVGTVENETFGLLAVAEPADGLAERIREAVLLVEPALGSARLAVGMSRAPDAQALRPTITEARHARKLAELGPGRASVVAGDEVASHLLLLAAVPEELRRSFGAKVLGPLLSYDEAHGSDLVHTLKIFLENSGSWTQTAAELHLHVNTLRYRVSRISELTGRDLGRFADRVDLYLAGCFTREWGLQAGE
ncbi:PucR family transcriptional regulator [Amycolatopsis sp. 195334CR]|uniref:PucR family transcriptional regulator n=1 Tax=Amycolatopsis sp. 195334CR TaxID=2814588 RepID=UPI001A8E3EA0|nr:PucR family transcriptional regulator [Amycolatopsis sp. 195334CR]MBN6041869.1 helix-turn-helix domain-containing protein [Amycolatopsis sp. 195334CR]